MIRMGDYEKFKQLLFKMIKLTILTKSHMYAKNLLLHAHVLSFHDRKRTILHKLMDADLSSFNEEPGEIAFSILNRLVLGDSMKSKFEHVNKIYKLISTYRNINDILQTQLDNNVRGGHVDIKLDSKECKLMKLYLFSKLQTASSGTFTLYNGTKRSYLNKFEGDRNQVLSRNAIQIYSDDVTDQVNLKWEQVNKEILGTFWLDQYSSIWPEGKASIPESVLRNNGLHVDETSGDIEQKHIRPVSPSLSPIQPVESDNDDDESVCGTVDGVNHHNEDLLENKHISNSSHRVVHSTDDDEDVSVLTNRSSLVSNMERKFERDIRRLAPTRKRKRPDRLGLLY